MRETLLIILLGVGFISSVAVYFINGRSLLRSAGGICAVLLACVLSYMLFIPLRQGVSIYTLTPRIVALAFVPLAAVLLGQGLYYFISGLNNRPVREGASAEVIEPKRKSGAKDTQKKQFSFFAKGRMTGKERLAALLDGIEENGGKKAEKVAKQDKKSKAVKDKQAKKAKAEEAKATKAAKPVETPKLDTEVKDTDKKEEKREIIEKQEIIEERAVIEERIDSETEVKPAEEAKIKEEKQQAEEAEELQPQAKVLAEDDSEEQDQEDDQGEEKEAVLTGRERLAAMLESAQEDIEQHPAQEPEHEPALEPHYAVDSFEQDDVGVDVQESEQEDTKEAEQELPPELEARLKVLDKAKGAKSGGGVKLACVLFEEYLKDPVDEETKTYATRELLDCYIAQKRTAQAKELAESLVSRLDKEGSDKMRLLLRLLK